VEEASVLQLLMTCGDDESNNLGGGDVEISSLKCSFTSVDSWKPGGGGGIIFEEGEVNGFKSGLVALEVQGGVEEVTKS